MTLVVYDGEQGIALEKMQGNQAYSRVDLGYPKLFHIPAVISVFFLTCVGFLGGSLYFRQANQGSLPVRLGTRNCCARNAGESGLISQRAGSLMVFLTLRRESGVCSRGMAGVAVKNFCLFSDVRTPV